MTERKVVPITGKHTTYSSMLAEGMSDPKAVRGFIIYFDEEGTMHPGHFGATRSDNCMAAIWLTTLATDMMRTDDD
jgi:hypothetical protein